MSKAKQLKARIKAWMKELRAKLAARSVQPSAGEMPHDPRMIENDAKSYREKILAKYSHLRPRGF